MTRSTDKGADRPPEHRFLFRTTAFEALRARAKANHRSVNAELETILLAALGGPTPADRLEARPNARSLSDEVARRLQRGGS